jgi:hypothetical protein
VGAERAERSSCGAVGDSPEDALDGSSPAQDRAKDAIAGASLCTSVHFVAVLLILEDNGEELRASKEGRIGMRDNLFAAVTENEVSESDSFRSAGSRGECILAGSHGEKEGSDDDVRGVIILVGAGLPAVRKLKEATKQSGSDGLLTVRRGVYVVESGEESSEGRPKLGSVRDVNGALLETTPERRSQVACGCSQS